MYEARSAEYIRIYESIVIEFCLRLKIHRICAGVPKFDLIHFLHDFAHKQSSQLNSLVLITVWRVVIEVLQNSQLNSSAFSHCSVWRVAIGKGVFSHIFIVSMAKPWNSRHAVSLVNQ